MARKVYLTTTFTPAMLPRDYCGAVHIEEVNEKVFGRHLELAARERVLVPAVGHQNTAEILRRKFLLSRSPFARVPLELARGDGVLAAIPQFRAGEAREFTDDEVRNAEFRYFVIMVD